MIARREPPPPLSPVTRLLLLCLLALAAPPLVQSQQDRISAYECVDPNNPTLTHVVRRGENTTVCLYVGPGGDWNSLESEVTYKRFSVNLVADEFSSYTIPGSFQQIAAPQGQQTPFSEYDAVHVFSASQSSLSFLRRYHDKATGRIYPYLTAIIDVKDGDIRGIAWDDACVFCEKKECLPNTYDLNGDPATSEKINQPVNGCYFTRDECIGFTATGDNHCDIKLNVAWTGTDVEGNVLLSSGSRPSMFPPNRLQENVNNQVDSMIEGVKNLQGKISSMGSRFLKWKKEV